MTLTLKFPSPAQLLIALALVISLIALSTALFPQTVFGAIDHIATINMDNAVKKTDNRKQDGQTQSKETGKEMLSHVSGVTEAGVPGNDADGSIKTGHKSATKKHPQSKSQEQPLNERRQAYRKNQVNGVVAGFDEANKQPNSETKPATGDDRTGQPTQSTTARQSGESPQAAQKIKHLTKQVAYLKSQLHIVQNKLDRLLSKVDELLHRGRSHQREKTQGKSDAAESKQAKKPKNTAKTKQHKKETGAKKATHQYPVIANIPDIETKVAGGNKSTITFDLSQQVKPKVRLINSKKVPWSKHHNWLAIDIFGTHTTTGMPAGTGIINNVKYGYHQKFERFRVDTDRNGTLSAQVTKKPGRVMVTLTRHGEQAASANSTSTHREQGTADDESEELMPHWIVRAISNDAAVIYDTTTNQFLSVRKGSRIPFGGIVTSIDAAKDVIHTTSGDINGMR